MSKRTNVVRPLFENFMGKEGSLAFRNPLTKPNDCRATCSPSQAPLMSSRSLVQEGFFTPTSGSRGCWAPLGPSQAIFTLYLFLLHREIREGADVYSLGIKLEKQKEISGFGSLKGERESGPQLGIHVERPRAGWYGERPAVL